MKKILVIFSFITFFHIGCALLLRAPEGSALAVRLPCGALRYIVFSEGTVALTPPSARPCLSARSGY